MVLMNLGSEDFEVKQGDRVAQLILERVDVPAFEMILHNDSEHPLAGTSSTTERGVHGFGSTGI